MATTTSTARREVHYANFDEVRADAERLARVPIRTIGNWSYPQILDHLTKAMSATLDGVNFKAPWFMRTFIAPFVRNSILSQGMKPGFRLPASAKALLPAENISLPTALDNFRRALDRFEKEPQRAPHPFFGQLARQEYDSLHLRHSELHLSFVVPDETV